MILNLIVIGIVLLIAYLWSGQGLFSSFLHLACTIVAGAIAFALWEPLASVLVGMNVGFIRDSAYGLSLILPFIVSLAILRVACDKLIPANLDFDETTNLIGGGALGLLSGVISAGILLISAGFLRLPPDFMGYRGVEYDPNGNLVSKSTLWLPADRLTVRAYEALSLTGFGSDTPLALRKPDAHLQAAVSRMSFEGKGRNAYSAGDFDVIGSYTVTAKNPSDLLIDSFLVDSEGKPLQAQEVRTLAGEPYPPGSSLKGFVVRFEAGAVEKGGQVVIGPAQIRLVSAKDGDAFVSHPIAVVTRAAGDVLEAGRFRFDAAEVFVATVGGATGQTMAFEFLVPPGHKPTDLYIKNARISVASTPAIAGAPADGYTPATRDAAVRSMALLGAARAAPDASGSSSVRVGVRGESREDDPVLLFNSLPGPIDKQTITGFELDENNQVISGRQTIQRNQIRFDLPKQLRVERIANTEDTSIVQVDVSVSSRLTLLGKTVDLAEGVAPPSLIDTLGQRYEAIGYIVEDGDTIEIRFEPGEPIRGLSQLPTLSRSKPDQKLKLLFRVSKNVELASFALGNKVIYSFDPTIKTF